jgi:IclR family acetate operon transcriptional repressor
MVSIEDAGGNGEAEITGDLTGRNRSTSLRRALDLLDYLAGPHVDSGGAALAELCRGTGLNKSTALRLLAPLAEARLVRQDPDSRRWALGPKTAYLGQMFLERLDLPQLARPSLKRLSRTTGETAHMVVLEGIQVCYVDKVEATESSVRMISRIGARQPLHCTGVGKCFLAYSDESLFDRVVQEGLVAKTERTITDPDQLRAELTQIEANGYAVDDVENEAHIRCVAAPIFQADGQICAALSVAGPTNRVTADRVEELSESVRDAAAEVTRELGAEAPPVGLTLETADGGAHD